MEEASTEAVNIYHNMKERGASADCLMEAKAEFKRIPEKCRNKVFANDDNPLSKHERCRICQEKLDALN